MNVHLHCIISNMKSISKTSVFPPQGKISADVHGTEYVLLCFNALPDIFAVTICSVLKLSAVSCFGFLTWSSDNLCSLL